MKTNTLIFIFLILTGSLYCQTSNKYLDMFGNKYFLSDTLFSEPGVSYYFIPQKKPFKYKLYGKHFLNEKKVKYMYGENENFFILKTVNNISDSIELYYVVDSINIDTINKDKDFRIVDGKNDYKILGFKIIADSIDYVISYTNTEDKWSNKDYMKSDPSSNDAKQQLINTIEELDNCTKLVLSDIYYFKKKENQKYYLKMDIILKK